jgi:phosphoglycolate phosphatase-like HAD superfamily hydrolase
VSRLEKIPLYLAWAGMDVTDEEVQRYCAAFSAAVQERVIGCAWVPGAREYLADNHARQRFVLISATPEEEMKYIVGALGMTEWFREVHGAPQAKGTAVVSALQRFACPVQDALLIGDSAADYEAARSSGVQFLLRKTAVNVALQMRHAGLQCEDFLHG